MSDVSEGTVTVDYSRCAGHGECALYAPGVFRLDGDQSVILNPHPGEDERAAVDEALGMCPEAAIRLEG